MNGLIYYFHLTTLEALNSCVVPAAPGWKHLTNRVVASIIREGPTENGTGLKVCWRWGGLDVDRPRKRNETNILKRQEFSHENHRTTQERGSLLHSITHFSN